MADFRAGRVAGPYAHESETAMGRVRSIRIRNFRSIGDQIEIAMPARGPLVLLGANNAGKSNIVRAVDLILGEGWPGSFEPDDHDHHGRSRDCVPMEIGVGVDDVVVSTRDGWFEVSEMRWRFDPDDERRSAFDILSADGHSRYGSGDARGQCFCMVIAADRRLQYQLSYASKWTLLSRLMRRFHETLIEDEGRTAKLRELFDGVVSTFLEVEPFSEFSKKLRDHANDFGANLEYGLEIDFSAYDPSNFFHSLRVRPRDGASIRSFDELGTGQEQILALAFAYAYAEAFGSTSSDARLLLVVEEPEAHLHPLAQRWLGRKIHELSALGVQVILTTHSPAFVDLEALEGLVLVRKRSEGESTRVVQLTREGLAQFCSVNGAGAKATSGTIAQFYASSATDEIMNGLFARACLLVEGPTEALALPVLLKRVGLDVLAEGIAVISVGGIGNLPRWWRLFGAYEIPTFVIFDRDSRDDSNGARQEDLIRTLRLDEEASRSWAAPGIELTTCCAVMVEDFESALRSLFDKYAGLELRGHERLGPSKPLAARYAVERLDSDGDDHGWIAIRSLAAAIKAAVTPQSPEPLKAGY